MTGVQYSNPYRKIIDDLNTLVKSRFIEMFGSRDTYSVKWQTCAFTDCCNVLYGFPFNSKLFNENGEGMPLIRIRDINSGLSGTYTTEKVSTEYEMKNGDLLVSMDGDFCAKIWNSGTALLNQRTCKMKGNKNIIDNIFLLNYLIPELEHIQGRTSATTVKHLSAKEINKMKIPIPSIELQNKFAEFVKQVDKSKLIAEQCAEKYDMLVKSRFIEMFGLLDLSPQLIEWKEIKSIGKVLTGSTPKTNIGTYWNGDIKWIAPAEISSDAFYVTDTERKITVEGKASCSLDLIKQGTVLLSSRAPIGKVAIAGTDMYCNQGFKNIECSPQLNNIFLYFILKNNSEYLNSLGRGATFKEISRGIVESIRIPVPPIELQKQFSDFVKQVDKSKYITNRD